MTLFKFTIWYDYDDIDNGTTQYRYVVASDEDEAKEKLNGYNELQIASGYAPFEIGRCVVDTENVIV